MAQKEHLDVWTYASTSSVTTPGDLTSTYWPGMRVALKQGTLKYFEIVSVLYSAPNTTITLDGFGIYTVANAVITAHIDTPEYSPKGFPYPSLSDLIKAAIKVYTDTYYALMAGRSGGQTINGGTGASENLTLQSTGHATKGKIIFGTSAYDGVNNRLGIGTNTPSTTLEVNGDVRFGSQYVFEATTTAGSYFPNASQHVAYYKKTGGYNYYWRSSDNGYPGGAQEADLMSLDPAGNWWCAANCSALSFTDRTDAFSGDALAEIKKIKPDSKGKIDHSTLPEFARHTRNEKDKKGKETIVEERNIGNMVSILTVAIQQLTELNEKLAARIAALEGKK